MPVRAVLSHHNRATVASQRRLEQLGENGVSVGHVDAPPPCCHISQGAGGAQRCVSCRLTRQPVREERESAHTPDDVPQRGEAQVDGCALFESVSLRPRQALPLAAGQVHQVDGGLLCDVLFGKNLEMTFEPTFRHRHQHFHLLNVKYVYLLELEDDEHV